MSVVPNPVYFAVMKSKTSRKRWVGPKKPPEDAPQTIVVITEENVAQEAFYFPRNRSISPFDKFWQEHRHEEKDDARRRQMDKDMEKYV